MKYLRPKTIESALEQLCDVRILAGGTDLAVVCRAQGSRPECLMDITGIDVLKGITLKDGRLHIGPCTTITELAASRIVPKCLSQGALSIGSPQIRNVATVGGNVCNASPCGDTLAPLIALSAEFTLASQSKKRIVPAQEFFLGPKKTILAADEILEDISIDAMHLGGASAFKMLGKRNGQVISQVNCAVWVLMEGDIIADIRIAFGSVGPVPMRALETERFMKGKRLDGNLVKEGMSYVKKDILPISDVRATAAYRFCLSESLFHDVMVQAGI